MNWGVSTWVGLLFLVILATPQAGADEPRKWSSRAGGFSVDATLDDFADGNVVLKKADGTTITVPLEKLSLADVRYVDEVMRKAEESARRKKRDPSDAADAEMAKEPAAEPEPEPEPKSTEPPLPAGRTPTLTEPNRSDWQVAPDLGVIQSLKAPKRLAIPVVTKFGVVEPLFTQTASPYVGIFQQSTNKSMACYDIRTGRKVGQADFGNDHLQAKALSPDGKQLAVYVSGQKAIRVLSLSTSKRWSELEMPNQFSLVNYMAFASSDRLLVADSGQRTLAVWDVKSKKKLHEIPALPLQPDQLALSPGGNYVAASGNLQEPIRIFDTRNGALAGTVEMPDSNGSYSSVEGVAFSMDGTEIASLSSGTGSAVTIWNLKDGKLIKQYLLDKPTYSIVSGGHEGPKLQYLPDKQRLLIHGRAVFDRMVGNIAWVESNSGGISDRGGRGVLADGRIVGLRGTYESQSLTAETLPWDEIERGSKVVAKGGTSEDANLPELSRPKLDDTQTKTFTESATWTASEPAVKPLSFDAKPISIKPPHYAVAQLSFTSGNPATVLLTARSLDGNPTGPKPQSVYRYDLEKSKYIGVMNQKYAGECLGFNASGEWALVRTGKGLDRLDIYTVDSGKQVAGVRPFESESQFNSVSWAGFADDNSLITLSPRGRLISWEIPSFKAIESTHVDVTRGENFVPTTAWLSPSRKLLIVSGAGSLQVLDSKSLSSVGKLESTSTMRGPWQAMTVAFDPSGRRFAATIKNGDTHTLAVWDFTTGKLTNEHTVEVPGFELTWTDEKYLIIHGLRMKRSKDLRAGSMDQSSVLDLIDADSGQVIWRYVVPMGNIAARGPDNRIWYLSSSNITSPAMLMGVHLPTPAAAAAIKKLPPRAPLLEAGSDVTLDVKFASSGSPAGVDLITDSIQADLAKQLIARGVNVKPRAGLVLVVTIREKLTNNRLRFKMLANGQELSVQETRVDCELVLKDVTGKSLWERTQSFFNEGQRLIETVPADSSAADHLRRLQWQEVLRWFENGGLPEKIFEPLPSDGLGESLLGPQGESNAQAY